MFFWNDAQRSQHEGIGLTRDISVKGMFVLTKNSPPLKSRIKVKAILRPLARAVPPLGMQLQGQVIRVETTRSSKNPGPGFAVVGERLILQRMGD